MPLHLNFFHSLFLESDKDSKLFSNENILFRNYANYLQHDRIML